METNNLDKAYRSVAEVLTRNLQKEIKEKAYRTGGLYRSVSVKTVPIQTGESIQASMNEYWYYVNDGKGRISPPRRFVESALQETDREIEEIIAEAAVNDIAIAIDQTLND
jgi:hypothetical protein